LILEPFFNNFNPLFIENKNLFKKILQDEDDLSEVVQLIGKDSLSEDQKLVLDIAKVIKDEFLAQNGTTDYDYFCPLSKSTGMLNMIAGYFNLAMRTIKEGTGENKKTWQHIKLKSIEHWNAIHKLKFLEPKKPDEEFNKLFADKMKKIDETFKNNF